MLFLQLILDGIVAGCLYGLLAMGFGLIYGATRQFHIAHAAVFAAAGYLFYVFVTRYDIPQIPALLAAVACAVLLGVIIVRLIYVPLIARGGNAFVLFLVSLGLLTLIENAFVLWLGPASLSVHAAGGLLNQVSAGGIGITELQLILIGVALACLVALLVTLKRTALGRRIRALSSNVEFVRIVGRRPEVTQTLVYALGSLLAGLAGVYQTLDTGMQPGVPESFVLVAFLGAILGGIGSVGGAFVAALLLGVLQNVLLEVVSGVWTLTLVFLIFLFIITFAPSGLAELRERIRLPRVRSS